MLSCVFALFILFTEQQRRQRHEESKEQEKQLYLAAQRAEAKTRVDRQVAVADSIAGQRQMYRAAVTDVAMARLEHYNNCDAIREEKVELTSLKSKRKGFRDRITQVLN